MKTQDHSSGDYCATLFNLDCGGAVNYMSITNCIMNIYKTQNDDTSITTRQYFFRLTCTLAAVMASRPLRLNFIVVNYFRFIYHEELIHISEVFIRTKYFTTVKEITSKYKIK